MLDSEAHLPGNVARRSFDMKVARGDDLGDEYATAIFSESPRNLLAKLDTDAGGRTIGRGSGFSIRYATGCVHPA